MKNSVQVKVGSCILKAGLTESVRVQGEAAGAENMATQERKKKERDILFQTQEEDKNLISNIYSCCREIYTEKRGQWNLSLNYFIQITSNDPNSS